MTKNYLADVTNQQSSTRKFYDMDVKTLVAQCSPPTGTREAQINFAVGYAAAPVKSDRLIVTEIGSALYAIGGNTAAIQEALGMQPGDRVLFSTDTDGNITCKMHMYADGSCKMSNDNGNFELKADGELNINNGNFRVLP
jgi:hypothetical protein